jgi:anti-sigma regulatory factor (Ser/Thr protein kinase)/predicted ArsR family transcriptional regulator
LDWSLDPHDREAASALRREIAGFLRRHGEDPDAADAAELAVEELLGNAVRHTDGPVWVSLEWSGLHPLLTIYDLGEGFDLEAQLPDSPFAEGGRGLYIVAHLTRELSRAHRQAGGNTVRAVLDVERRVEPSFAPVPHRVGVLPTADEADEGGQFGKESFLRALVVQLARALEERHGPDAAQAAVAQVGTDVGGRMEQAYRQAAEVVGTLTPEQMADCYVRLKHAIDGEFYVIEASAERIVLGNRACPFGDVVRRSPSLCRMTSSVFGGIASRNAGGATVLLEERIALGDPQCRVVVELGPPEQSRLVGHRYPAPAE